MNFVKNKYFYIVIVLIGLLIAEFIIFNGMTYLNSEEKIRTIFYAFSSTITSFGIVIAIIQLSISKAQKDNNLTVIRTEKSLNMMKLFSEILDELSFISAVLGDDDKYSSLIGKYNHYDYTNFTNTDFCKKFDNEKDRNLLTDKGEIFERNFDNIVMLYSTYKCKLKAEQEQFKKFASINWDLDKIKKVLKEKYNKTEEYEQAIFSEKKEISFLKNKLFLAFIDSIDKSLNTLEYFAAHFISDLADEEIVYQSLHQVFISTVMYFYPFISYGNNKGTADEYYTNITRLYNKWSLKYKEQQDKDDNIKVETKKNKFN